MKRKGAGKKGLLLVVFVFFASKGVFGEGKYFDGYKNAEPTLAMTTELKLDKPLGAYLRFGVVSDKGVFPYIVTGITRWTRSDLEVASGHLSDSDSDVSYGIGADFDVAEDTKINVEYMDYVDGAEMETSGFSFGASWTF